MCGIFAYKKIVSKEESQSTEGVDGQKPPSTISVISAAEQVLAGLKRLEYRGYDSWGIATLPVASQARIVIHKQVGKIGDAQAVELPAAPVALGHTRWATHGGVTVTNAHPHLSSAGDFAVVHNGVVENVANLKVMLVKEGYQFHTQTDTEIIVRLVEKEARAQLPTWESLRQVARQLTGRNTFALLRQDGVVLASRQGSPLVVGVGKAGDWFLSSDVLSFADQAVTMIVVEDGQLVELSDQGCRIWEAASGKQVRTRPEPILLTGATVSKAPFEHFMLKEIMESSAVIEAVLTQSDVMMTALAQQINSARMVYTIGSGTAGIAADYMSQALRALGQRMTISLVGAEASHYLPFMGPQDVLLAPSQSGETADVLEVLEIAKQQGVTIVSYVNMPGSTMSRLSSLAFLAQAGPEMCVMSTKVFTSQLAWGYLVAKYVQGEADQGRKRLNQAAQAISTLLHDNRIHDLANGWVDRLETVPSIFLLGKGMYLPIMREGMVKLIEGSYKHAHALPAGDLKHYAITLMEEGVPVIVGISQDADTAAVLTAASEVKARGATVFGIGPQLGKTDVFDVYLPIPSVPELDQVVGVIPLQLVAYYLAKRLGHDVDHPRNIAKSVTVK